ncbi:MAG: ABC transporter ATP-binding protein [bacterium]
MNFKKNLIQQISAFKGYILLIFILGIIYSLSTALLGLYLGSFLHQSTNNTTIPLTPNHIQETINNFLHINTSTLLNLAIFLIAILLIKNISFFGYQYLLQWFRTKLIYKYRITLFKHIIQLDFHYFDKKNSGKILAVLMDDIQLFNNLIETIGRQFILNAFVIISLITSLCIINYKLTLICFSGSLIVGIIIYILSQYIKKKASMIRSMYSKMLHTLQEMLLGIQVIKGFNYENKMINNFKKINQDYIITELKRIKIKISSTPIQELIIFPFILFILYSGNSQIKNQTLTKEELLQFFTMIGFLAAPLKLFIAEWLHIQETIPCILRIKDILETKSNVITGKKDLQTLGDIKIKNLYFQYDSTTKKALNNISLTIKNKQFTGIIGESGSGKSTLIYLLLRFYHIKNQNITCQNIPIQDIKLQNWRQYFGYVPQNPFLFKETIKNNLCIGKENASNKELIEACKIANAWEFIETLPNKLDTPLGENGSGLSGGQKQRIAIARAILKKPQCLIFDEATSQLDNESDLKIQEALHNIKEKYTLIAISHRHTNLKHADKIIILDQGKISKTGSYNELFQNETT